jgi:spore maturation protein CgeB
MRVLLLIGPDPWIELYQKPFQDLGHEVDILRLTKASTHESIETQIKNFKPDFCICQSLYPFDTGVSPHGDFLESFLEEQKIPTAAWMVDGFTTGTLPLRERFYKHKLPRLCKYFSVDRGHMPLFEAAGVETYHLPLGVHRELRDFKPAISSAFQIPHLSFVGAPPPNPIQQPLVTDEQVRETFKIFFLIEILDFLKQSAKKAGAAVTEEEVMQLVSQLLPAATEFFGDFVHSAVDYAGKKEIFLKKAEEILGEFLFFYFKIYADSLDFSYSHFQAVDTLRKLTPKQIQIFGGERWKNYLNTMSDTRRLTQDELHAVFGLSDVVLCLTKWHFKTMVHERVLQVLACGGFPLTDDREELHEMFRPGEFASFKSFEEMQNLVDYYLSHETERKQISARGRERIFAEHTYHHRAETILKVMQSS